MSTSGNNLAVPGEARKSSMKKSLSVDQGPSSSLAVKGLGKRQKSFVQFDDNAVVIDDEAAKGAANTNKEGKKGTQNFQRLSYF